MGESRTARYARYKTLLLEGGFAPAVDPTRAEEGAGPSGEISRAYEEAVLYVRDFEAILDTVNCTALERRVMISRWLHYRESDTEVLIRVAESLGLTRDKFEQVYKRVLRRMQRHWRAETACQLKKNAN